MNKFLFVLLVTFLAAVGSVQSVKAEPFIKLDINVRVQGNVIPNRGVPVNKGSGWNFSADKQPVWTTSNYRVYQGSGVYGGSPGPKAVFQYQPGVTNVPR